jgi:predicted metalloprotease with PDZ domain
MFCCMHKWRVIYCFAVLPLFCNAQNPLRNLADGIQSRFSNAQPVINYTLSVDTADLSVIMVELKLKNISDTFRLAMYSHPLGDDKYWRYVETLTVIADEGNATAYREDSALWKFVITGNNATVKYKIHLPTSKTSRGLRQASRSFLRSSGGLVGDFHNLLYVVGQTLSPCFIHFRLPAGWQIATGLEPTADPTTFYAASAAILLDAPALIGHFSKWQFQVSGVPHTIAYWALPDALVFDTAALVSNIQKIVTAACKVFGRLPYREYYFLLQDGSYGALEHSNSVTVGVPSKNLARDVSNDNGEIAHEYFHAWNMMSIVPVEYTRIDYKPPHLSRSLWWSEGLTMFYADLLLRRAGIPEDTTTRAQHLTGLIEQYLNDPGNHTFSAEQVSMSDIAPPGYLGDYYASTHLQGELIGNLLDMIIRNATDGKRNIDDLMRKMFEGFGGAKGFSGKDVEQMTNKVCNCDVHLFFENYIRGNKMIDFDKYFALLGLKMKITKTVLMGDDKKPAVDPTIYVWTDAGSSTLKLGITDPQGCWGKAGLHTGDVLLSIDDSAVSSAGEFFSRSDKWKPGDAVTIEIKKGDKANKIVVHTTTHDVTSVTIERAQKPLAKAERLYGEWIAGQ